MKTSELDRLLTPAKRAVYDRDYDKAFRQLFAIIEKLNKEIEEHKGDSKWANVSTHQM